MTYPVYSKYKDSGVEWIGKVPSVWKMKRAGHHVDFTTGFAFKSEQFSFDSGVKLVRGDNVTEGKLRWGEKTRYWPKVTKEIERYLLRDRDILIGMDGSKVGKNYAVVHQPDLPLLLVQRVARLRTDEELEYRYLAYLIGCELFRIWVALVKTDPAIPHISPADIRGFPIPFPSSEEQTQIATFLDRETQKIDRLIEKQQQLIKLLQEKRQAVISHAVTKGLNPNAKMKDSGVEWLGKIPEHWEMVPLKYLCTFSGGGTPSKDILSYWIGGDIPWVSPKDMKTFWVSNTQDKLTPVAVEESTTNYVASGALLMVVRSGILQKTIPIAINTVTVTLNQDMKALRFNERMNVEYAANYIKGHTNILLLEWSKEGATVESIEQEYLSAGLIPIPPIYEQIEINRYLKNRMSILQGLIDKAEIGINLLKERRTALISAAVTGKIDVRNITMDNTDQSITEQDAISA